MVGDWVKKIQLGGRQRGKFKLYFKTYVRGSMTVEMSFLMPIILMLIMSTILATFYFHDKNILAGAAYETAVVGSTKAREKNGVTEAELERLFQERARGKCILFSRVSAAVSVGEKEILVDVSAKKGRFALSVVKKASVTTPETHIRNVRRLKEIKKLKK